MKKVKYMAALLATLLSTVNTVQASDLDDLVLEPVVIGELPSYKPIEEGTTIICTDGQFSINLSFDEVIDSSSFSHSYFSNHATYEGTAYGVYGPRLSGTQMDVIINSGSHVTRAGDEFYVSAKLPEIDGHLSVRKRYGYYPMIDDNPPLSGFVTVGNKSYRMKCD